MSHFGAESHSGPSARKTIEEVVRLWHEHEAQILSLMHVGADGWLKTLDFAPVNDDELRSILCTGERADGSSLFPGCGLETRSSDMLLRPRPERAFIDPFSDMPTVIVLCRHEDRTGAPLAQSPDTMVRNAHARLRDEANCDLWALGEVEFFLGRPSNDIDQYGADDGGYHAASPFVFGESVRRQAIVLLRKMGIPVKYAHSEVGYIEADETNGVIWEQHEIELNLLPLPEAADAIVLTQWVLRNLAHRNHMRCSTEPIVVDGHPGNGLHIHLSPRVNDHPIDIRPDAAELSPPGQWLIAGLVRLGGALMAFGNCSQHSFARLQRGREVPRFMRWGAFDRAALVRLPTVPRDEGGIARVVPTVEFRLPDGSAHPHLLLAGIAQAMTYARQMPDLDDLMQRTNVRAESSEPDNSMLPRSNAEIGDALDRCRVALEAGNIFPSTLLDQIIHRLRN